MSGGLWPARTAPGYMPCRWREGCFQRVIDAMREAHERAARRLLEVPPLS